MNIKKGDKVLVLAGKDKDKSGSVVRVICEEKKIIVDKVNIVKKHSKSRLEGVKGEVMEKSMPINISNVQLVCPKCGKATRVGKKVLESGKRVRVCKKCGEEI